MDYLSSGYRAVVRPRRDSDDTIAIRWYRAGPNARVYEKPHAFGSDVDDDPDFPPNLGVGTLPIHLGWSSSVVPVYPGTEDVANEDYLLHGLPADVSLDIPCFTARLGFAASYQIATPGFCLLTEDLFHLLVEDLSGCIEVEP